MKWIVEFEPPAQAEVAEAFEWYEDKSYGLGGVSAHPFAAFSIRTAF